MTTRFAKLLKMLLGIVTILIIKCQTKLVYKINFRTPALVTLKNLMRHLTVQLDDDYCSITIANYRLITIIRFVVKSYTYH